MRGAELRLSPGLSYCTSNIVEPLPVAKFAGPPAPRAHLLCARSPPRCCTAEFASQSLAPPRRLRRPHPRAARERSTDLRRIARSRLIRADVTEPFSSCAGHRHETANEREVLLTFRVSRIRHRWTIGTWFLRHLYLGASAICRLTPSLPASAGGAAEVARTRTRATTALFISGLLTEGWRMP